ncbi:MAG TPA: hypothetical protein VML75_23580 [Kofleriaceae bacterium]|nr:hypothetical protein [Kofleriaceae bacterium]
MSTPQSQIEKTLAKLEDQLHLWRDKLDAAVANAKVTGQEAKISSRKQLDELKSKLDGARSKLDDAKAAGSEKWDAVKDGVEHAWQDLETAFKRLVH